MRKRRVYLVLLILAVAGVVGLVVVGAFREREPAYGGKRLREWVEAYPPESWTWVRQAPTTRDGIARLLTETKDPMGAIRHIGTNALPYLVKWMDYEAPPWKRSLYARVNPMLRRLNANWELSVERQQALSAGAWHALLTFGPEAKGVLPELTELLHTRNVSSAGAGGAASVLANLGDPGLEQLLQVLTDKHCDAWVKTVVVYSLGNLGTKPRAALPVLKGLLHDPDLKLRTAATNAVRIIDGSYE